MAEGIGHRLHSMNLPNDTTSVGRSVFHGSIIPCSVTMHRGSVLNLYDKFFSSSHEDTRILRYSFISHFLRDAPAWFEGTSKHGLLSIENFPKNLQRVPIIRPKKYIYWPNLHIITNFIRHSVYISSLLCCHVSNLKWTVSERPTTRDEVTIGMTRNWLYYIRDKAVKIFFL